MKDEAKQGKKKEEKTGPINTGGIPATHMLPIGQGAHDDAVPVAGPKEPAAQLDITAVMKTHVYDNEHITDQIRGNMHQHPWNYICK